MIEFEVLGPLRVRSLSASGVDLALMPRRLLALLLAHSGDVVHVDVAIEQLWPIRPPRTARKALQVYVHRLRSALGVQRIIGHTSGYRILIGPGELDAHVLEDLAQKAKREIARGAAPAASRALSTALELWRSTPYQDITDVAQIDAERDRLIELRGTLVNELASVELALGRHQNLVPVLRAVTQDEPYREDLHAHLMLALHRGRRKKEALEVFQELRHRLADELGIEPNAVLQKLHRDILRDSPELISAYAANAAVRPAQLPAKPPGFAGRASELALLESLTSARGPVVISAIAGAGGVGKTALALHWAYVAAPQFPDGQLYANLRGFGPTAPAKPEGILAYFLRSLGVRPEHIPADTDEAAALFRSLLADRTMLIVLDNARDAEQVRPLLPAGRSAVLVTSRDQLAGLVAIDGARRLDLGVLRPEESLQLLRNVLGDDRVSEELDAATELARLCCHVPLALRIAAAELASDAGGSIASFVGRLEQGDRLSLLEPPGDVHHGLNAVFGYSYLTINADGQRMFRLLGVAPVHDISTHSAAALAGVPLERASLLLERLTASHLVQQIGADRYGLHDLLRLYAHQHAKRVDTQQQRQEALSRLLEHFLSHADAAAKALYPNRLRLPAAAARRGIDASNAFDDAKAAKRWLDRERLNLFLAIKTVCVEGPRDYAWLLLDALRGYLGMHPDLFDAYATAEAAAAAADQPEGGCVIQQCLAEISALQGRGKVSRDHLRQALVFAQEAAWAEAEASVHTNLGGSFGVELRLADAEHHLESALAINSRLGVDRPALRMNLGLTLAALGRLNDARLHEERAVEIYQETGQPEGHARALTNVADTLRQLGQFDAAFGHAEKALSIADTFKLEDARWRALDGLAAIHRDAGRWSEALAYATQAAAIAERSANPTMIATVANTLGTVLLGQSRLGEAITQLEAAIAGADRTASRTDPRQAIAAAYAATGQFDQAIRHAQQALTFAAATGARILQAEAMAVLGEIALAQGERGLAVAHGTEALRIFTVAGHQVGGRRAKALLCPGHLPDAFLERDEQDGLRRIHGAYQ